MGITYAGADLKQVAYLDAYDFDSEIGDYIRVVGNSNSNNFSLKCDKKLYSVLKDGFVFCENSPEHGGRVTSVVLDSNSETMTVQGRTWLGVLEDTVFFDKTRPFDGVIMKDIHSRHDRALYLLDQFPHLRRFFAPAADYTYTEKEIKDGRTLMNLMQKVFDGLGIGHTYNDPPLWLFHRSATTYRAAELGTGSITVDVSSSAFEYNHVLQRNPENGNTLSVFMWPGAHNYGWYPPHDGVYIKTKYAETTNPLVTYSDRATATYDAIAIFEEITTQVHKSMTIRVNDEALAAQMHLHDRLIAYTESLDLTLPGTVEKIHYRETPRSSHFSISVLND